MRPTLNLDFRHGARGMQLALYSPMQGFDALRIISQIISLQCLHYLILSFVLPPLLATLTLDRRALRYQGGPTSLSMILDWREIAGIPPLNRGRAWPMGGFGATEDQVKDLERLGLTTSDKDDMNGINKWWEWELFLQTDTLQWTKDHGDDIIWSGRGANNGAGGHHEGADMVVQEDKAPLQPKPMYSNAGWWPIFARDRSRGWVIVLAWAVTGLADVFLLSVLIRRPTHILDHTLTLHLVHFLLTSLYTRVIPSNLFYWLVMLAHAGACIVWAEALSIRRELHTGWTSGWEDTSLMEQGDDDVEQHNDMTSNGPALSMGQTTRRHSTHVLFDGEEDDEGGNGTKSNGKEIVDGNGRENIEMKRIK